MIKLLYSRVGNTEIVTISDLPFEWRKVIAEELHSTLQMDVTANIMACADLREVRW